MLEKATQSQVEKEQSEEKEEEASPTSRGVSRLHSCSPPWSGRRLFLQSLNTLARHAEQACAYSTFSRIQDCHLPIGMALDLGRTWIQVGQE
jgi:hypothetical protein